MTPPTTSIATIAASLAADPTTLPAVPLLVAGCQVWVRMVRVSDVLGDKPSTCGNPDCPSHRLAPSELVFEVTIIVPATTPDTLNGYDSGHWVPDVPWNPERHGAADIEPHLLDIIGWVERSAARIPVDA